MGQLAVEPALHDGEGCPVERLGRRLKLAWLREDELDDVEREERQAVKAKPRSGYPSYPEGANLHLQDRRDALRASLSAHRAASLAGCLCQIAEANSLAGDVYDAIEEPAWEVKANHRAVKRLLYSVLMHLEEVAGLTVDEAGMGPTMPDNLNPWIKAEETLARLRRLDSEVERRATL